MAYKEGNMKILNLKEENKISLECDCGYSETINKTELTDNMWICRECGKIIKIKDNNALDEEMSYEEIELELDEEAM